MTFNRRYATRNDFADDVLQALKNLPTFNRRYATNAAFDLRYATNAVCSSRYAMNAAFDADWLN